MERDAKPHEIKRAYRRKSKEHHPDRGGDPEMMALINIAHDTLMDPARREHYDLTGDDKPITDTDREARNGLTLLFGQYLNDGEKGNVVKRAKRDLESTEGKLHAARAELLKNIRKVKERRPEVSYDGKERNLWADIIDSVTADMLGRVGECDKKIAVVHRALEMLMAYRSDVPEQRAPAGFGNPLRASVDETRRRMDEALADLMRRGF